ncbi:MFS transporter [Actinocatenispora rupis]|uniref:MFS transporter n=1 Tax=Actinocatenispora rupis TaxID=519421 RepID=A0A8J3JAW5_9ACTN|nr:MFS transporter [Actinocatenispora rupis]GID15047.1 hypothetical protein Aru02nite_59360 [Actinocatenispora rupis]
MIARLARHPGLSAATRPATRRERRVVLLLAVLVTATATLFFPSPAQADPSHCTIAQWQKPDQWRECAKKLPAVSSTMNDCMGVPTPARPDSGFGGWFAANPKLGPGITDLYSKYGYAGYTYPIYNPDCASGASPLPSDASATTTIANGELMVATGIVGAANAFRERAYEPDKMWGWSDKLVKTATKAVYQKVFSIFGVITIAVVGLYLLWRSRQANMSDALTTAGWAVLVMVVVTAVAAWPLVSAHLADSTLVTSLGIVHDAVGPQSKTIPLNKCENAKPNPVLGATHDPRLCYDHRPPAVRAGDTATEAVLYNNWLRGTLGSATSDTAKRYGRVLYDSGSLTWQEAALIQKDPSQRNKIFSTKADTFRRVAQEIKVDDPDAYNYLQGKEGSARIGAGLISIISALAFGFFDIAASLLIILGFLIFRWAVVAIPVIGTIAILRPASAGFKRLINIVVAAIFNIIIFGAGASIYLFAVDIIMNTASLPGWLQITLVWLCGIVGWLLLRPYRRITQLGGKSPMGEIANIGSWHKRFFSDLKGVAIGAAGAAALGDVEAQDKDEPKRKRADQTKDSVPPAGSEGPVGTDSPPPSADDPAPAGSPTPRPTEESTPEPERRGTPAPAYAGDDRVWVPETGRYADGSEDRRDLSYTVGQSEAALSADASSFERDFSRHQGADASRSRN